MATVRRWPAAPPWQTASRSKPWWQRQWIGGRADILVNNAGILRDRTFAKMDMEDFRAVIDVHLMGSVYCTKAVWEIMRAQNYGRIVMTTSSTGLYGNFGQSNYGAAKMALVGLMQTLSLEGKKNNIHVNCIAPTAATRMMESLMPIHVNQPLNGGTAYLPLVFGLYQANLGPSGLPLNSPTVAQQTAAGLGPGAFGRLVQTIDPHFTNQKVYQASLSVQQQLARDFSLELGYLFYRGNHLPATSLVGYTPTNAQTIDPVLGPVYQEAAPYTTLLPGGSPFDFDSNGVSTYHGGTVSLTKRLSRHYQFQANYTYSRSIDDATDFNTAFASYRPNGLSVRRSSLFGLERVPV